MDDWARKDQHNNQGVTIVIPCNISQRGAFRCSSACHGPCWSEIQFHTGVWSLYSEIEHTLHYTWFKDPLTFNTPAIRGHKTLGCLLPYQLFGHFDTCFSHFLSPFSVWPHIRMVPSFFKHLMLFFGGHCIIGCHCNNSCCFFFFSLLHNFFCTFIEEACKFSLVLASFWCWKVFKVTSSSPLTSCSNMFSSSLFFHCHCQKH